MLFRSPEKREWRLCLPLNESRSSISLMLSSNADPSDSPPAVKLGHQPGGNLATGKAAFSCGRLEETLLRFTGLADLRAASPLMLKFSVAWYAIQRKSPARVWRKPMRSFLD